MHVLAVCLAGPINVTLSCVCLSAYMFIGRKNLIIAELWAGQHELHCPLQMIVGRPSLMRLKGKLISMLRSGLLLQRTSQMS